MELFIACLNGLSIGMTGVWLLLLAWAVYSPNGMLALVVQYMAGNFYKFKHWEWPLAVIALAFYLYFDLTTLAVTHVIYVVSLYLGARSINRNQLPAIA